MIQPSPNGAADFSPAAESPKGMQSREKESDNPFEPQRGDGGKSDVMMTNNAPIPSLLSSYYSYAWT